MTKKILQPLTITLILSTFLSACGAAMLSLPQEKFVLTPTLAGLAKPLFRVKNPEANALQTVRFYGAAPTLSQEEKSFLELRDSICSAAQSKFLGIPITSKSVLRIAIIGSGGGDAAALYLLHFLKALEDVGLFPAAVHYLAGISGSTFTIGGLYSSMKPFDEYYHEMRGRAQNGFLTNPVDKTFKNLLPLVKTVADCTIQRVLSSLPPSGVDPYGAMLMLHYSGNDSIKNYLDKTLTTQLEAVYRYQYPLPLYQAGIPIRGPHELLLDIFEMTPLRVTNYGAQADIPASSFNWPIGTLIGVCGSAFSTPMSTTIPILIDKLKPQALFKPLKKLFTETAIGDQSLFPTYFHNFAQKIAASPYANKKLILAVDAGASLNIPFIPFVLQAERDIDLFIVADAGGNVWTSNVLFEIAAYCKERSIPFPAVYRCNGTLATIFKENPPSKAPVVLYFPISSGNYEETMQSRITESTLFKRSPEALRVFEERTKIQVGTILEELKHVMLTLVKSKEDRAGTLKQPLRPFSSTASKIT